MIATMNAVLDRPWTTIAMRAWRDQREVRHQCNSQRVISMSGTRIVGPSVMPMVLWPTAPQAGAMTVPDGGISAPRRSVRQSLTFAI